MRRKATYLALLGSAVIFSGCGGVVSSNSAQLPGGDSVVQLANPVRLSQLGVLPASDSGSASYLIQLTNYGQDKYTLESARILDLGTGKDSKLVSVVSQACGVIAANGSCSIQLTPHTLQSADVKLEVHVKDEKGSIKKLVQIVRIDSELNAKRGGIVMLNDVSRIVTEDGNYSLSIPVVLGENYDEVKASNGNLFCNTPGYQKGNSCTYLVNGKIVGSSAVVSTRLEGTRAGKTETIQDANTKVEVAKGAHLLLSSGVKIMYPEVSTYITMFNSGNTEATDILSSIQNNAGLQLDVAESSPCGTELAANDYCKIKVNVAGVINGQSPVTVAYKDNGADYTAITNVSYTVANAMAGVQLIGKSNNLANAIVSGKVREALIEVENTGNRELVGVNYYLAPSGRAGLKLEPAAIDGCDLSGNATLALGAKCNLSVKYTPTAAEAGKSINLVLNSKYKDEYQQEHSLVSLYGLVYSADAVSAANLELTKISGNDILFILTDGRAQESATWSLRNTLAADENLPASDVNIVLDPTTIDGLTISPLKPVECPLGTASIAGGSSCEYVVNYGPTKQATAITNVTLKASYSLAGKGLSNSDVFKVQADERPKISVSVEASDGGNSSVVFNGNGSQATPWTVLGSSNNFMLVKYVFSNVGNFPAERFNVDVGNLPRGFALEQTNCNIGTDFIESFNPGESCEATFKTPVFDFAPNLQNSNLNSASLKIDVPYSYIYDGSVYSDHSDSKYVNFSRLWTSVSHSGQISSITNDAYEFEVVTNISPIKDSRVSYPITVTPTLKNPIAGVVLKPCTIDSENQVSCINKISLPKDLFVPSSKLLVTFTTQGNSMNGLDEIVSDYLVVVDNTIKIKDESGLRAAFKASTAGKYFILERDIALVESWPLGVKLESAIFDGNGHTITNLRTSSGFFDETIDVVIKNLSMKGKVTNVDGGRGLLINRAVGSLVLLNSNFNSTVLGTGDRVGGIIGDLNATGGGSIESITVVSQVEGNNLVGGLIGRLDVLRSARGLSIKNIRARTQVKGYSRTGGLFGYFYGDSISGGYSVKGIIADTTINVIPGAGTPWQIGGVFAGTMHTDISNVEANVSINAGRAEVVGGIVGNLSWTYGQGSITDAIVHGKITTVVPPTDPSRRIAGIASANTSSEVNNLLDDCLITYNVTNSYYSPLTLVNNALYTSRGDNIFFAQNLPGITFLSVLNPGFVKPYDLTFTPATQAFLEGKGFDFNKVWTSKKYNGITQFGIREDSIPQFPQW